MLRFYMPRVTPMERELAALGDTLFNPANWGRDILSRESDTLQNPVRQLDDGSYKMELFFDLHKFKPSDVSVSTEDGRISVKAAAESKSEDGSFYSSTAFQRSVAIPEGVDKDKISAKFTEAGGLVLEAPAEPPKPKEQQRIKGDTPLTITHH